MPIENSLKRRQFLQGLMATTAVSTMAGCGGNGDGTENPSGESSPTPTPSDTPTATPTTTAIPDPEIVTVSLISGWKEYGDVLANQIESISPSERAIIGMRAQLVCSNSREVRWRNVTTVENESGDVVASESGETEQFSNACADAETSSWEQAARLSYNNEYGSEWPRGTYTATVRIDDYYGQETVYGSTQFEVASQD